MRVPDYFVDVEGQPLGKRQTVYGGPQIDRQTGTETTTILGRANPARPTY